MSSTARTCLLYYNTLFAHSHCTAHAIPHTQFYLLMTIPSEAPLSEQLRNNELGCDATSILLTVKLPRLSTLQVNNWRAYVRKTVAKHLNITQPSQFAELPRVYVYHR